MNMRFRKLRLAVIRLHRRVGVAVVVFVVAISVTGVLINHANTLGWDRERLVSPLWLALYGVETVEVTEGYGVDAHWLAMVGNHLYFDEARLVSCKPPLRGVVVVDDGAAALCDDGMVQFTAEGELIEKMPVLGGRPLALGVLDDVVHARLEDGHVVRMDLLSGDLTRVDNAGPVVWSAAAPLPEGLSAHLSLLNVPEDLTWERLMQDLHSGRLFGPVGVLVVDLLGLLMTGLALTGLWVVVTRPR